MGLSYLACVLREVARKQPALVEQAFFTRNNLSGFHLLRLMADGQKRELPLDDWLHHRDGELLLSTPSKQLWPALLEKAWVKLHGGYKHAQGRSPEYPLQELFGLETSTFELNSSASVNALAHLAKEAVFLIAREKELIEVPGLRGIVSHQVFVLHAQAADRFCLASVQPIELKAERISPMDPSQLKPFGVPY